MEKKLKIGWFSFSCCEDSTIIFTELLNDHYQEWKKVLDFKTINVMQKKGDMSEFDVAFIEGAITADEQAEKLKQIREHSKKIVAIGSCAVSGWFSAQRNSFDEAKQKEIEFLLLRFKYAKTVKKVSEVVPVDDSVGGCPMEESAFLKILDKYLKEFEITSPVSS